METEKSFSGEEAEKDFCGRLFFLAAIFPFSNEKACLGVTAKTDFFYRLKDRREAVFFAMQLKCIMAEENQADEVRLDHPSVFERRYPLLSQYPKLLVSDPGSNTFGQDRIRR